MLDEEEQVQEVLEVEGDYSDSGEEFATLLASSMSIARDTRNQMSTRTSPSRLLLAHVHVDRSIRVPKTTATQKNLHHCLLSLAETTLETVLEEFLDLYFLGAGGEAVRF